MKRWQKCFVTSFCSLLLMVHFYVPAAQAVFTGAEVIGPSVEQINQSVSGLSALSPGIVVTDPGQKAQSVIDKITTSIKDNWKKVANVALRTALNTFLSRLAYDSAVFVASGFSGQQSALQTQPLGEYFKSAGDAAAGGFIEGIAKSTGLDAAGLCDPGADFRINLTLGLETNFGQAQQPYKPACTLTELGGNWKKAYADPNFSKFFEFQFDSTANPLGIALEVNNLTLQKKVDAIEEAKIQRQKGDFKDQVALISKSILTPGSTLQEKYHETTRPESFIADMVEEPAVNALNIFMSTLVTKLMDRVQKGIVPVNRGQNLASLLAIGSSSGRKAAEALYADLKRPVFTTSGTFDILSELSTCSAAEEQVGVNSCAIGSILRQAITGQVTVQEFLRMLNDGGKTAYVFAKDGISGIENDAGLTSKGIVLLKKYRIVPVGWQLAAEYIQYRVKNDVDVTGAARGTYSVPTLQQIASCYNACGGAGEGVGCDEELRTIDTSDLSGEKVTDYSPFCKLVDPSWVLKASQNYCEREAVGPDVVVATPIDDDANSATQSALITSRLNYCADNRGCIAEDDKGNCSAYGYCTKEDRIYRFQGTSCNQPYASCQTFTDQDGNDASYLKSSINYDGCATDPGCQWYCNSKDSTGNFNCASSTSTLITCSDANNDHKADSTDNFDYVTNNGTCACSVEQTCEVAAGSERGTDVDGNGIYDYWQCLVPDSGAVCTLDDTCGASNPAYHENSSGPGTCTCTVQASCSVPENSSQCSVSFPAQDNNTTSVACGNTSNTCTSDDDEYTTTPVCQPKTGVTMSCVDSAGNTVSDSCSVSSGASSCTSDSGNTCIIGTIAEVPVEHNDTLFLDDNTQECSSDDAGCNRYLRVQDTTNLLSNALFTYNTTGEGDNVRNFVAFCSNTGNGCATDAECDGQVGACTGWLQQDADVKVYSDSGDDINSTYVELSTATGGKFEHTVDTGYSVNDRTFTFSYRAKASSSDCSSSFGIGATDGTLQPYTVNSVYTADWTDYFTTVTFPNDSVLGSSLTMVINATADCTINVNATQLTESDSFDNNYVDYGNNAVYLNGNTVACQAEDVGCELYTMAGKSSNDGIPGTITNPQSDVCVNTDADGNAVYDYSNPACNQCNGDTSVGQSNDYNVGCDFYQAAPLTTTTPIQLSDDILGELDDKSVTGATTRTGYYCSGDSATHCYNNGDCQVNDVDNGVCQPLTSIVPSTAKQCSVAQVGCEEYTNLAAVEQGGEGIEYYTKLQQCVTTTDDDIATFYTFEGSNNGGVQVQDHLLKQNRDNGAPCTHLDLLSQEFNAECKDDTTDTTSQYYVHDCGPNGDNVYDSTHPDCRQYVNDAGVVFYRYESETIPVTDNCTALRNSLDGRTYYTLPSSSVSCSEQAVGCREFKGTDSGDVTDVIDEDFSSNSTEEWTGEATPANESVLQGGYSLQFTDTDSDGVAKITHTIDGLTPGKSYILSFWAKVTATQQVAKFALSGFSTDYYFTNNGSTTNSTDAGVVLDPYAEGTDWQQYTLGPVILNTTESSSGDKQFIMQYEGSGEAYIDTIQLVESSSQYLVQDTARLCQNFEGCRQYKDRANTVQYLKSFQRLCDEAAIGCEALVNTQNSTNPFTEGFDLDNEYSQDDTMVPTDAPITLVYDEENVCSDQVYGCTAFGRPDIDERTGKIESYTPAYLYNRPDDYSSILCEQPQLACRQYTSDYDGTAYFKDPGDKVCELRPYERSSLTLEGWFKKGTTAKYPDCPLQYQDLSDTYASQPLGGVCNSNSVVHNSDGTVNNRIGALCTTDADCYPAGWQSGLPIPRCISDPADDVDEYTTATCLVNGQNHAEATSEADCQTIYEESAEVGGDANATWLWTEGSDDGLSLDQARGSDYGWVGTCAAEQSGCTEYIDPYSPNIEELNENWSFEYDVYDASGSYYANDGTSPDGWPDDWKAVDGEPTVIMTNSLVYSEKSTADSDQYPTVDAADGAAAIRMTNGTLALVGLNTLKLGIDLDATQSYTLQAMVRIPVSAFDIAGTTTDVPAQFSIGLLYYGETDLDGDGTIDTVQLAVPSTQTYMVADHLTINEDTDSDGSLSKWYRLQGNIGLGTSVPLPTAGCTSSNYVTQDDCQTAGGKWLAIISAGAFITNHTTAAPAPLYVDALSFKQNDRYYYVDYTVDGTAEHRQTGGENTCTTVSSDGNCVAFRDATTDTQTYAQDGLACATCISNPTAESCREILDACDTNTILTVKPDRICSEWLACETAYIFDANGEQKRECFDIAECTKLDKNNNCAAWAASRSASDLNSSSDLYFTSAAGDTNSLQASRDLTGYVKAGMVWKQERLCNTLGDADKVGTACVDNSSCYGTTAVADMAEACSEPFAVSGYYPYGWMYEVANFGPDEKDLIAWGSFEELFCRGDDANSTRPCINNATIDSGTDSHCYETTFTALLKDDNDANNPIPYVEDGPITPQQAAKDADYYCPNTPDFGTDIWPFEGWTSLGDGKVSVTQYDAQNGCGHDAASGFSGGCPATDVNNVLAFKPKLQTVTDASGQSANQVFTGGVQYDLGDLISSGEYALTFNGRYNGDYTTIAEDPASPSALSVCLRYHGLTDAAGTAVTNLSDCFVNGYGEADIVFAIDSSGTMTEEIAQVKTAAPELAKSLAEAGIATRFALVDVENVDHIEKDFTDIDGFTAAINNLEAHDHCANQPVDMFEAVTQITTNTFPTDVPDPTDANCASLGLDNHPDAYTLNYAAGATRFIIAVTDTDDEKSADKNVDNGVYETDAINGANNADTAVFVITSSVVQNTTTGMTYDQYYSNLASNTGGSVSNQIGSTDWVKSTDIVDEVFSLVRRKVDIFQFTNEMKTYTFGPKQVENLAKVGTTYYVAPGADFYTTLEFLGADGSEMQIDTVSMLPVLEVSKELSPIARSCRAYPTTDAKSCDFVTPQKTTYQGWHGYCLEKDPTNANRCMVWWPLDIIAGESSLLVPKNAVQVRADTYSCLVSKGYEAPGFCDTHNNSANGFGEGISCKNDADCTRAGLSDGRGCVRGSQLADNNNTFDVTYISGEKQCVDNNTYICTYSGQPCAAPSKENEPPECDSDIPDDYCISVDVCAHTGIACTYQKNDGTFTCSSNTLDTCVSVSSYNNNCSLDGDATSPVYSSAYHSTILDWVLPSNLMQRKSGIVSKFGANPLMKNIHMSEIETIEYNTGGYTGDQGEAAAEYPYWGQQDGPNDEFEIYDHKNVKGEETKGNIWLTDFKHGSVVYEGEVTTKTNPNVTNFCYAYNTKVDARGVGCGVWGLWDNDNFKSTYYDDKANPALNDKNVYNYDLAYVWAWSNYNDAGDCVKSGMNDLVGNPEEWLTNTCIEPAVKCVMGTNGSCGGDDPASPNSSNPWKHFNSDFRAEIDKLNDNTYTQFYRDDLDSWDGWDYGGENGEDNVTKIEGSNIQSLWIDFNDLGYMQNVYHFYYFDAQDTGTDEALSDEYETINLTFLGSMSVNLYLRESCALVANVVNSEGKNFGWSNRLGGVDPYAVIRGEDSLKDVLDTTNSPFGSISPQTGSPESWDTFATASSDPSQANPYDFGTYGSQPAVAYNRPEDSTGNSKDVTAGYPVTCIGECATRSCIGNSTMLYKSCASNEECKSPDPADGGKDIIGKCMGIGDDLVSGMGYYANTDAVTSYSSQLLATAKIGRDRLKHVFADVVGDFYRFDPPLDSDLNGTSEYTATGQIYTKEPTDGGNAYWNNDTGNIFDTMPQCEDKYNRPNADGGETEYCGVLPRITNFEVLNADSSQADGFYTVATGAEKNLQLSFTMTADLNQEPIQLIYIDFGDDSTPKEIHYGGKSDNRQYMHAYKCVSTEPKQDYCEFTPKITIVDNWNWCSGELPSNGTNRTDYQNRYLDSITGSVSSRCNSYDEMGKSIKVYK